MREGTIGEALRNEKFINNIKQIHLQEKETLNKSHKMYKPRHDQHKFEKTIKVGDKFWLHLNTKRLHGYSKNIKAFQYGPFEM